MGSPKGHLASMHGSYSGQRARVGNTWPGVREEDASPLPVYDQPRHRRPYHG